MTNRVWSACLAMLALTWMPSDAAACAMAPDGEDDECAEFVWGYDENGVRVSGKRTGAAGEATETLELDVGVGGLGAEAGARGTRTIRYPFTTYKLSNGESVTLNCVTYEPVDFIDN